MVSRVKIIKNIAETYVSEIISIALGIIAGTILTILILPFNSFIVLILIIPGLLSVRGNTGGSFATRSSRDLIIGNFNKRTWFENVSATIILSSISGLLLGILSVLLNIIFLKIALIDSISLFFLPLITLTIEQIVSLPISTLFSYLVFKYGLDPNNIVSPIMTGIDDVLIILCFYLSLKLLGVP
ncbi:MAG: magnesium transporter [Candidatus Lokiarchaeota archaeon]|nr:magnesium transporter [Candidatus Lokiarchaeota archaeon]